MKNAIEALRTHPLALALLSFSAVLAWGLVRLHLYLQTVIG